MDDKELELLADTFDRVTNWLEGWSKAYPISVFGEVTAGERAWLHASRPGLMDRIAADMGRHMASCIASDVAELRQAATRIESLAADAGRARAMCDEYQRWIDFYHSGDGDYGDFLRRHVFTKKNGYENYDPAIDQAMQQESKS